jgi:HK97 family phage portal protein
LPFTQRNDAEQQMKAMGSVGTLFAIITALANNTSRVEWKLYRTAASGKPEDRAEVARHAALDVWNKPNPFMPRQEFTETVQQHVDLTGEGWWVIARNPASPLPLEIWPVRPDRITPVPDPVDFIRGYVYTTPDGGLVPLETRDVIQLRMPNPLDPYRGMGPVQAVLVDLDATRYTSEWNRNFFLNSSEPGGIIEVDKRLSDAEFDELRERWAEQHRGVAAAHRVALIESGMKWVERGFSQRDMQFAELRSVSRDVIREAFGIPKFAVGDVDDVNRATAEASRAWFAESLLVPRLERIKGALNEEFLPLYGPGAAGLEFDYVDPVPANREADNAELTARANAAKTLVDAGFEPAAVLEAVGLPEITHLGSVTTSTPEAPAADPGADMRALVETVQKVYLGVGTVLTWEEARAMLVEAGADIDPNAPPPPGAPGAVSSNQTPPPEPAAPVLPPGAEPAPAEGPALAPPGTVPSRRAPAEPAPPGALGHVHIAGELTAGADLGAIIRHVLRAEVEADAEPTREDWEDRVDALVARWSREVTGAQIDELVGQIESVVDAAQPAALAELTASSDVGAAMLADAMFEQAAAGAQRMAELAAEQGQSIAPAVPIEPPADRGALVLYGALPRPARVLAGLAEDLRAAAMLTAKNLTNAFTSSAAREALRVWSPGATGREVAQRVRSHLEGLTTATLGSELSAAIWAAENEGRAATLEQAEADGAPAGYFLADEVRDKNTCGPCAEIDGRRFDTLADVQAEYPFGGYRKCEGRARCRGTFVPYWE